MPELPRRTEEIFSSKKIGTGDEKMVYIDPKDTNKIAKVHTRRYRFSLPPEGDPDNHRSYRFGLDKTLSITHTDATNETLDPKKEQERKELGERWRILLGQEFYLTKILKLLYPHNITDIHLASIANEDYPQTIHERIVQKEKPKASLSQQVLQLLQAIQKRKEQLQPTIDTSEQDEAIKEKFNMSGVVIDTNSKNFLSPTSEPNTRVYIDTPILSPAVDVGLAELEESIHTQLNGHAHTSAMKYFKRLTYYIDLDKKN